MEIMFWNIKSVSLCVPINIFGKYLKKDEGFWVLYGLRSVLNYLLSYAKQEKCFVEDSQHCPLF
jgi:hypothetical protein